VARPASKSPTDGELAILKVMWELGPAELGQICAGLRRDRQVASTTVATMLKVMLAKGLVRREDGPRGYLWSAEANRRATTGGMLVDLLDRAFDGSARRLVSHLLDSGRITDQERDEIRRLLNEHRDDR
jgi:BlaI family penicillinase repressor